MDACLINCTQQTGSTGLSIAAVLAPAVALTVGAIGFFLNQRQQRAELLRRRLGAARIVEDDLRRSQTVLAQSIYELSWPGARLEDKVAPDDLRFVADLLKEDTEWAWVTAARASVFAIAHEKGLDDQDVAGLARHPGALRRLFRAYWQCEVARRVLDRSLRWLHKPGDHGQFRLHDRTFLGELSVWMGAGAGSDPILRVRLHPPTETPGQGPIDRWIESPTGDYKRLVRQLLDNLAVCDPTSAKVVGTEHVAELVAARIAAQP